MLFGKIKYLIWLGWRGCLYSDSYNVWKIMQSIQIKISAEYRDMLPRPSQVCQALQWCHNGLDSVSNHKPYNCLLKRLFRRRSKKTSKLRVTGLCAANSPETGEFPAQRASNAENVSIWWRHHESGLIPIGRSPGVPDISSRGLGNMSRYSAQILICFTAYIAQFLKSSVGGVGALGWARCLPPLLLWSQWGNSKKQWNLPASLAGRSSTEVLLGLPHTSPWVPGF